MLLLALVMVVVALSIVHAAPKDCQSVSGYIIGDGHDIRQTTVNSQKECCDMCRGEEGCKSWTFHSNTNACWIHDKSSGSWKEESGVVSGVPSGDLPPRPAPTGEGGGFACSAPGDLSKFKFCDNSLSIDERLTDLVPRINISDMASQLTARQCDSVDSIGVPSYYWYVVRKCPRAIHYSLLCGNS